MWCRTTAANPLLDYVSLCGLRVSFDILASIIDVPFRTIIGRSLPRHASVV
jgi:hypothetical protein